MHRLFILFCLMILFVSCNENLLVSEYRSTQGSWEKDEVMEFSFSELDTVVKHHMFINVRNDNSYPFSNLFLIAELEYPDGRTTTDTLEYEMAKPSGEWLGKGSGSLKENKLWFKEDIVFPDSGVYKLHISHAMRKTGTIEGIIALEGITDVGFEIEKSNL